VPEDRDASEKIEITPKMMAAGVSALLKFNPEFESEEDAVSRIFSLMYHLRPQ